MYNENDQYKHTAELKP